MSTTHYYGDDCIPPHESYEPDPEAVREAEEQLAALQEKVAAAETAQQRETPKELVEEASLAFDALCEERHLMGQEKYGPVKFMTANTLEEAMAEVLDLANYARYTFVKLFILNRALNDAVPNQLPEASGFIPNREDGT